MLQGMLRLLVARSSGSESRFRSTSTCHDKVCRRSIFSQAHIARMMCPYQGLKGPAGPWHRPYQGLQGPAWPSKNKWLRKNGHVKQDQASAWTLYGASRQAPQEPMCSCRHNRFTRRLGASASAAASGPPPTSPSRWRSCYRRRRRRRRRRHWRSRKEMVCSAS